jgi:hypothetical protein
VSTRARYRPWFARPKAGIVDTTRHLDDLLESVRWAMECGWRCRVLLAALVGEVQRRTGIPPQVGVIIPEAPTPEEQQLLGLCRVPGY